MRWRQGRKVPINVYEQLGDSPSDQDRPVTQFHTVADAKLAVEAVNRAERARAGGYDADDYCGACWFGEHDHCLDDPNLGSARATCTCPHCHCEGTEVDGLAEHDKQLGERVADLPCPTCTGPVRETVGMVCQTCGTDYSRPEPDAYRDPDGQVWMNLRKHVGHLGVYDADPSAVPLWLTEVSP